MNMGRSAIKVTGILLVVALLLAVQTASIKEARGDYSVSITGSSVSVNITTAFSDNLTTVRLPTYSLALSGSNASSAASTLSSALSQLVPGASVSMLTLSSVSTANSTSNNVSFNVEGVASSTNGELRINMAWKSFDVTSDITNGNVSLNLVGNYLSNSSILSRPSSTIVAWSYSEDGSAISSAGSLQAASSFNLLDFSQLSEPLESWPQSFNLTGAGTTTLTNMESHNMTITETLSEGGTPFTVVYLAAYSHHVRVAINGSGSIIGDSVFMDANNSNALIMLGIIIASLAIGSSVVVTEWRINKSARYKARKKDRATLKK
jgi:hypothetical protein